VANTQASSTAYGVGSHKVDDEPGPGHAAAHLIDWNGRNTKYEQEEFDPMAMVIVQVIITGRVGTSISRTVK